jgi:hypothetical protein
MTGTSSATRASLILSSINIGVNRGRTRKSQTPTLVQRQTGHERKNIFYSLLRRNLLQKRRQGMHNVQPVENRLTACEQIYFLEGAQTLVVDQIYGYLAGRESVFDREVFDEAILRRARGDRDMQIGDGGLCGTLMGSSQRGDFDKRGSNWGGGRGVVHLEAWRIHRAQERIVDCT